MIFRVFADKLLSVRKMRRDKKAKDFAEAPADMFMMMAENARTINTLGSVGPVGQQFFLDRFSVSGTADDERRLVEELTK